jgi:hypothetical protein
MSLPIWQDNPHRFAHVSWSAEAILRTCPKLPRRSANSCPHEGVVFDVSVNPVAWARIARIGTDAPVLVLEFDPPALDYHEFVGDRRLEEMDEVSSWAISNKLVKLVKKFLVWHYGGEESELRYFTFKEGDKELEDYREQLALGPDADESVESIEEARGWEFTSKMRSLVSKHYKNPNDLCLTSEVLNQWLAREYPEIGMVWYADVLDVANLSAPRGAILPAHFKDVRSIEVVSVGDWPSDEDEMETGW